MNEQKLVQKFNVSIIQTFNQKGKLHFSPVQFSLKEALFLLPILSIILMLQCFSFFMQKKHVVFYHITFVLK